MAVIINDLNIVRCVVVSNGSWQGPVMGVIYIHMGGHPQHMYVCVCVYLSIYLCMLTMVPRLGIWTDLSGSLYLFYVIINKFRKGMAISRTSQ